MVDAFHVPTMLNSQTFWPNAVVEENKLNIDPKWNDLRADPKFSDVILQPLKQIRINEEIKTNRFMVPSLEVGV